MSVNAKGSSLPESTLMMVTEGENLLKYTTTNVIIIIIYIKYQTCSDSP